jgi:hypothetical protein
VQIVANLTSSSWAEVLMSQAAVRSRLPVVVFVVVNALAACSGADQTQPVSVAGTVASAAPSTENTTAVEKPQAPRGGNPGIAVASLPVGGQSAGSPGTGGAQCLSVNWVLTTNPIPPGLAVKVTDFAFDPGVYRVTDDPCPGSPCSGFTFQGSERACDLPVRPVVATATALSETEQVTVSMGGHVLCTDYSGAACRTFVESVRGLPSTLALWLPVTPEAPTVPAGPTTGSATNAPLQSTSATPGG